MKRRNQIYKFIAGTFLFFVFYSCEKNIEVDIPKAEEKVVIEGSIELNDYSKVFLTKNLPYFGTIDSTMISDLIIQDATVIVSDGILFDTLNQTFDINYFPPFFYQGTIIKGEVGKTYFLTVKALGKTFTSSTTIPQPIPLDSIWFKVEPHQDSLGYVWADFTDPPEMGNYYRLFTKRLSKDKIFVPILGSVYDDKLFNGQTFNFSMIRGTSTLNSEIEDPEFGFYKTGDTIIVKASSIDNAHYDFWRSAEQEIYSGGNPFANPTLIATNIEGGGLGVWGGYGSAVDTIIAK